MIVDIISDVVDKVKVFDTVDILRGVQSTYGVFGIATKYFYLDAAEGDLTSVINVGDRVWPQGGTWNYPPTVAAIRTVAAVDFVSWFGHDVTRIDVTTYPESTDNTQIVVTDLTVGYYTVTLNPSDIQYWYVGARMKFKDGGTYYYGVVTLISSPIVIIKLDNDDELSSITEFAMVVNYIHGHPIDVFNQLSEMAQNPDYKLRDFPAVLLMQDFEEEGSASYDGVAVTDVLIAIDTKPEWTAAERKDNSFSKLHPLGRRFIHYLERSPAVYWRRKNKNWIDRMYWGKTGALGSEENKASSFIDAIELNIKELNILQTC